MTGFRVIDPLTGLYPDIERIARKEAWVEGVTEGYLDGFAMTEGGQLLLIDDCGNYTFCPYGRFEVRQRG